MSGAWLKAPPNTSQTARPPPQSGGQGTTQESARAVSEAAEWLAIMRPDFVCLLKCKLIARLVANLSRSASDALWRCISFDMFALVNTSNEIVIDQIIKTRAARPRISFNYGMQREAFVLRTSWQRIKWNAALTGPSWWILCIFCMHQSTRAVDW
jgi:hypothetical protein